MEREVLPGVYFTPARIVRRAAPGGADDDAEATAAGGPEVLLRRLLQQTLDELQAVARMSPAGCTTETLAAVAEAELARLDNSLVHLRRSIEELKEYNSREYDADLVLAIEENEVIVVQQQQRMQAIRLFVQGRDADSIVNEVLQKAAASAAPTGGERGGGDNEVLPPPPPPPVNTKAMTAEDRSAAEAARADADSEALWI